MIVIDTNVLSEAMRDDANTIVLAWLDSLDIQATYTTAITEAELLYGLYALPEGKRRDELYKKMEHILAAGFQGRVLSFDRISAKYYAEICSARRSAGKPISVLDAQIAAICARSKATLATRNTKDFVNTGIKLINPWEHR